MEAVVDFVAVGADMEVAVIAVEVVDTVVVAAVEVEVIVVVAVMEAVAESFLMMLSRNWTCKKNLSISKVLF